MLTEREIEAAAKAIREEIDRQHREEDKKKCPAGAYFWECEVRPQLIATAALEAAEKVK